MSGEFSLVLQWVVTHGYLLLFLLMFLEGPIVTAAAGFAAALGYFNPVAIYLLSFGGDFSSDLVQYGIGYWGRTRFVERYGHRIGFPPERVARIEEMLRRHAVRGLVTIKLLPIVPTIGLFAAGAIRMPFRQFALTVFSVIAPKSFLFLVAGYYFGAAYETLSRYLNAGITLIGFALILVFVLPAAYRHASKRIARWLGREIETTIEK